MRFSRIPSRAFNPVRVRVHGNQCRDIANEEAQFVPGNKNGQNLSAPLPGVNCAKANSTEARYECKRAVVRSVRDDDVDKLRRQAHTQARHSAASASGPSRAAVAPGRNSPISGACRRAEALRRPQAAAFGWNPGRPDRRSRPAQAYRRERRAQGAALRVRRGRATLARPPSGRRMGRVAKIARLQAGRQSILWAAGQSRGASISSTRLEVA